MTTGRRATAGGPPCRSSHRGPYERRVHLLPEHAERIGAPPGSGRAPGAGCPGRIARSTSIRRCTDASSGENTRRGKPRFHQTTTVAKMTTTTRSPRASPSSRAPAHRHLELMRRGLRRGGDPKVVLPLPADLGVQRHQIDGVAGEMPGVHGPAGAARDQLGLALACAQASWTRKSWVAVWIARSTTRTRSGCMPCSRSRDSLLRLNSTP